jgi:hypothetical protein
VICKCNARPKSNPGAFIQFIPVSDKMRRLVSNEL